MARVNMAANKMSEALNCATNMQEASSNALRSSEKNAIQGKFILILFLFTLLQ